MLKDYQQQLIIRDYVRRKKLKTDIVSLPIVRESSGLAMSFQHGTDRPPFTHVMTVGPVFFICFDETRKFSVSQKIASEQLDLVEINRNHVEIIHLCSPQAKNFTYF